MYLLSTRFPSLSGRYLPLPNPLLYYYSWLVLLLYLYLQSVCYRRRLYNNTDPLYYLLFDGFAQRRRVWCTMVAMEWRRPLSLCLLVSSSCLIFLNLCVFLWVVPSTWPKRHFKAFFPGVGLLIEFWVLSSLSSLLIYFGITMRELYILALLSRLILVDEVSSMLGLGFQNCCNLGRTRWIGNRWICRQGMHNPSAVH